VKVASELTIFTLTFDSNSEKQARKYLADISYYEKTTAAGDKTCQRCSGLGTMGTMFDCSKIIPICPKDTVYMICPRCLSSLGKS